MVPGEVLANKFQKFLPEFVSEGHIEGRVVIYYSSLLFSSSGVSTCVGGTFSRHFELVLVPALSECFLVVWGSSFKCFFGTGYGS